MIRNNKNVKTIIKWSMYLSIGTILITAFGVKGAPRLVSPNGYSSTIVMETKRFEHVKNNEIKIALNENLNYMQVGLVFRNIKSKYGIVELPVEIGWELILDEKRNINKMEKVKGYYLGNYNTMEVYLFELDGKYKKINANITINGELAKIMGEQGSIEVYRKKNIFQSYKKNLTMIFILKGMQLLYYISIYVWYWGNQKIIITIFVIAIISVLSNIYIKKQ